MKNILVAIDFSDMSDKLVDVAKEQAGLESTKIWLLHVAAPDPDFVGYGIGPRYIRDDRAGQLKDEHRRLSYYKKELQDEGYHAEALMIQGPTVLTIKEETEKLNADLLIIGKKGHSMLYKAFVGSVLNEALPEIEIPMLVIPDREVD